MMATAGLIRLGEGSASEHACVGSETEEHECEKQSNQHYCYCTLGEEDLVCRCGFGGREDIHYRWDGEKNEDDHHEGRKKGCEMAVES